MHDDVARAALDEAREAFGDVRVRDLQEGGLDGGEAAQLADAPRRLAHVRVGLLAPAPVPDHDHPSARPDAHADTPAPSGTPSLSSSSVVWRAMKAWKLSPAPLRRARYVRARAST